MINNDIGSIIDSSMTSDEVSHAVGDLTPGEKYIFLTEHYKPSQAFQFPKVYQSGCNWSILHVCMHSAYYSHQGRPTEQTKKRTSVKLHIDVHRY